MFFGLLLHLLLLVAISVLLLVLYIVVLQLFRGFPFLIGGFAIVKISRQWSCFWDWGFVSEKDVLGDFIEYSKVFLTITSNRFLVACQ